MNSQKTFPRAKRHFGQHFLHDTSVVERMVEQLGDAQGLDAVLEIGGGTGMLTQELLAKQVAPLYVIEIDPSLAQLLRNKFPSLQERIICQDLLTYPLEQITTGNIGLIGNLPYNVASQILLKAIDMRHQVPTMVYMLQREVAARLTSPPGNRVYGWISVWTQAFYRTTYCFEVVPDAFVPPPKVTSAVIQLIRWRTRLPCDESYFLKVLKAAFQQRRKTIRNALKVLDLSFVSLPDELLAKRAEALSVDDFINLTQALKPTS